MIIWKMEINSVKLYYNMIKVITVLFPVIMFGQFSSITNGIGVDIGASGSGVFFTRHMTHQSNKFGFNGEIRLYDIKSKEETIVYDYYTNQYKTVGGKSLFMIPAFVGGLYYPFAGKIANNFSPFISLKSGAIMTFDGKEVGTFSERWSDPAVQVSPGGFIGVGIDFKWVNQSSVKASIGMEILPLRQQADNEIDYSGLLIHISFNRLKK